MMASNLKMKIENVFQSALHKLSHFTKLNTIEFEIQWQFLSLGCQRRCRKNRQKPAEQYKAKRN